MNSSRREFLGGLAGAGFLGVTGCASLNPFGSGRRYAAQLYSINQIIWKDTARIFRELKAAGYDGVEFAGYNNHTAKELKAMLDDAGLVGAGSHVNGNTELVGDALKRTLDFAAEAGLVSVSTPHASRDSEAGYAQFGRDMGHAADVAATYGIRVGVHCTYHHFTTKYGDRTAWDVIFQNASPRLVQQVDTCNAMHVGVDVVKLLKKYPNSHWTVHLKENIPSKTATLGERPTDGGPTIPWKEVLGYLATEDVGWYVVEAEKIPDSLEPLKASVRFLESV